MNKTVENISNKVKARGINIVKLVEKNLLKTEFYLRNQLSRYKSLDIHFFTLVINGMPFIRHHIETFRKLNMNWQWHIIEGVADLKHDTAWSLQFGGRIKDYLHKNGLSNDGTSEYIDELARQYPNNMHIYRKPKGKFWNGKVEMCNIVLKNIESKCLLWQIDVDEFWTAKQIETMIRMFEENPEKTAAWFYCRFFVGPHLIINSRNTYSNNTTYEWLRVWRYKPGIVWTAHEPPTLMFRTLLDSYDMGRLNPFTHKETEEQGLIFNHLAYVLPKQLLFKETYYGYRDALKKWQLLQESKNFPTYLRNFFPWVKDKAVVNILDSDILDAQILKVLSEFKDLLT